MRDKEAFNTIVAAGGSRLSYVFGAWDEPLKFY